MKKGGIICICLLLAFMCCVPLVAQPSSKSVETMLIDNFDTADEMDWTWEVQASKFIHVGETDEDTYPKMGYVEAIPNSLRAYRTAEDGTPYVLGVQVSYDRKGDNWFEIFPVSNETGENYEIPLLGQVSQIDFWVWGSDYNYYLELLVRDADSVVHILPATMLNFEGWKNVVVQIPTAIRQQSRLRSGPENMSFIGFRVRTTPSEFVDDFVIYLDQFRYTTNTMNFVYDGFELRKPNFESQSSSSTQGGSSAK